MDIVTLLKVIYLLEKVSQDGIIEKKNLSQLKKTL